jgi:hypothetical protein
VGVHGLVDEDGQLGRGPADLQAAAGQRPGDETADDARDQPELGRHPGGDGDADTQGQRDKKDDEGRAQIGTGEATGEATDEATREATGGGVRGERETGEGAGNSCMTHLGRTSGGDAWAPAVGETPALKSIVT